MEKWKAYLLLASAAGSALVAILVGCKFLFILEFKLDHYVQELEELSEEIVRREVYMRELEKNLYLHKKQYFKGS